MHARESRPLRRCSLPKNTAHAPAADGRRNRNRLHVGDGGRAAKETDVGGEWRLEARLAGLALQALDERRLLAADVRTGAAVDVDVERVARAARVLANVPAWRDDPHIAITSHVPTP